MVEDLGAKMCDWRHLEVACRRASCISKEPVGGFQEADVAMNACVRSCVVAAASNAMTMEVCSRGAADHPRLRHKGIGASLGSTRMWIIRIGEVGAMEVKLVPSRCLCLVHARLW